MGVYHGCRPKGKHWWSSIEVGDEYLCECGKLWKFKQTGVNTWLKKTNWEDKYIEMEEPILSWVEVISTTNKLRDPK